MAFLSKAWTFPLALLVCGVVCAQEYSFKSYGTAEGLNDLSIRAIYQDRMGFLWVATLNGFFRYDGERFEAFGAAQGVPSSPNTAFADAPDGSLLALGAYGLIRLRGNRFEAVQGPFGNTYGAIGIQADGRGHTYIGTDQGLVELSLKSGEDKFTLRQIPQAVGTSRATVEGVFVDGETVWYGCGLELCRMDHGQTEVLGRDRGLPPRQVTTIRKDSIGNLWVRVRNDGVYVMPAGQARFRRPDLPIPGRVTVGVPALDTAERILLPSADGLLIQYEKGWRKIGFANGLRLLGENYGGTKPQILTEFGRSVSRQGFGLYGGNTLEAQRDAMLKYYRDILDSGATGMCPFYYADGWWKAGREAIHDDEAEEWFGFIGFKGFDAGRMYETLYTKPYGTILVSGGPQVAIVPVPLLPPCPDPRSSLGREPATADGRSPQAARILLPAYPGANFHIYSKHRVGYHISSS